MIAYNHLNLPTEIKKWNSGTNTYDKILFTYDAGGALLKRRLYSGYILTKTVDYIGSIELVNNAIESINHSEGRYTKNGSLNFRHEYFFKDHLGNTRLVYSDLNNYGIIKFYTGSNIKFNTEILQESHYYPYGLEFDGKYIQNANTDFRYKYNGIERITDLDINYDFAFLSYLKSNYREVVTGGSESGIVD